MIHMLPVGALKEFLEDYSQEEQKPNKCGQCDALKAPVIARGVVRYICFGCDDDPSSPD